MRDALRAAPTHGSLNTPRRLATLRMVHHLRFLHPPHLLPHPRDQEGRARFLPGSGPSPAGQPLRRIPAPGPRPIHHPCRALIGRALADCPPTPPERWGRTHPGRHRGRSPSAASRPGQCFCARFPHGSGGKQLSPRTGRKVGKARRTPHNPGTDNRSWANLTSALSLVNACVTTW